MRSILRKLGRVLAIQDAFMMLACLALLLAPAWRHVTPWAATMETLRKYADELEFSVGTPLPGRMWSWEPQYRLTLAEEFNSAVSMVFMKLTQPGPGQFDFRGMDRDIQFAQAHNLKLFGAALIYRANTLPPWLLEALRRDPKARSQSELDRILRNHIHTVVKHGGNTYQAWEVVNEPLSAPNDPWGRVLGKDEYIAKAFRYTREANPTAQLVLNQAFGQDGVNKRYTDSFFDLIKRLKASGVPIDVAGIEMHLQAQLLRPTYIEEFRYFLSRAREAGVQAQITEMDVYQGPLGLFQDPFERQKQICYDVLSTCLQDSGCTGFYTWGLTDKYNWPATRSDNPLPDAKPLLFNEYYAKKPAYFGVLDALRKRVSRIK